MEVEEGGVGAAGEKGLFIRIYGVLSTVALPRILAARRRKIA